MYAADAAGASSFGEVSHYGPAKQIALESVVMASSSPPALTSAGERGDIPDCVLSELWSRHSESAGSPLIDILSETDCSSPASEAEQRGGGDDCLDWLPMGAAEKLVEVVEDDDFGAVSEGGGLIWVVENDVAEADHQQSFLHSPPEPQSVLNGLSSAGSSSPQHFPVLSERESYPWNNCLQKPSTRKPRKPSVKLKSGEPASRFRPAKSPRESLTLGGDSCGMGWENGCGSPVVRIEPLPGMDACGAPGPRRVSAAGDGRPPAQFCGFGPRCWPAARARWLRQLAAVAAEERRAGHAGPTDSALLRLRELATAVAAARPPAAASRPPPTYVSLMPSAEKDGFKGSFLSMLNLHHVSDPPPTSLFSQTMRHRLRKRKPAVNVAEECEPASALRSGPGSPLQHGRRLKVLRRRGGSEDGRPGEEAAERPRLLDLSQLVEVEGVLDTADTYSGSEQPPPLLPEPAPPGPASPPPAPPELPPQRWPRADAARCPVCRKFLARVLLPLHLRLHRTGYRGCDVCGQVLASAAALYRHRLEHEPPRFRCRRCGRQFDTPAKLERHRATAHALLCSRCGAPVTTPELVQEHVCEDRPEPPPADQQPPPDQQLSAPDQWPSTGQQPPSDQQPPSPDQRLPPPDHQRPPPDQQPSSPDQQPSSPDQQPSSPDQPMPPDQPPSPDQQQSPADQEPPSPERRLAAAEPRVQAPAGDGRRLVCRACGKPFLVRFNYTMHMRMAHQWPGCPDVLSCASDMLGADLYSEILSVV